MPGATAASPQLPHPANFVLNRNPGRSEVARARVIPATSRGQAKRINIHIFALEDGYMTRIYVDGQEGTTGLKIRQRLERRGGIELITIDADKRHDPEERARCLNAADIAFLCLPDQAAREAVELCTNPATRIIDASTAHRVSPGWVYGFPELIEGQYERIAASSRVAVPGCYASGFCALVYPLRRAELLCGRARIKCNAVSGYTGAGKKAIAAYESADRPAAFDSPRKYALAQAHKHLPEMQAICGLDKAPIFEPMVCDFPQGMLVSIPLYLDEVGVSLSELHDVYQRHFAGRRFVEVMPLGSSEDGFIDAQALRDTNLMQIFVCGNEERATVTARLDNLGKGASGAALQCMNIMLGEDETLGLM